MVPRTVEWTNQHHTTKNKVHIRTTTPFTITHRRTLAVVPSHPSLSQHHTMPLPSSSPSRHHTIIPSADNTASYYHTSRYHTTPSHQHHHSIVVKHHDGILMQRSVFGLLALCPCWLLVMLLLVCTT